MKRLLSFLILLSCLFGQFKHQSDVRIYGFLQVDNYTELDSLEARTITINGSPVTFMTQEAVEDFVGAMMSGNTETLITVTYEDSDGTIDFVVNNDLSNYDNSTSGFITATLTEEQVEDFVGGMLAGTETRITVTYDDAGNMINFVVDDMNDDSPDDDSEVPNAITVTPINATTETAIETVVDLQDLQGSIIDGQVPNNITIDLATTSTNVADADKGEVVISSGVWSLENDALDDQYFDAHADVDHDQTTNFDAAEHFLQSAIDIDGEQVELAELGTATYDDVQNWINNVQSSGITSGGGFTDIPGTGTITVAAGTGFIRATNSDIAEVMMFDWAEETPLALTDNATNYIQVNYHVTTPTITASITKTADNRTKILLGKVFRGGTSLHFVEAGMVTTELAKRTLTYLTSVFGEVARASGFVVGETGNRYLTTTDGVLFGGLTRITTSGINTSTGDDFEFYYYDGDLGGGADWVEADSTFLSNFYYNNIATGLAELTVNRYGVQWIYGGPDGHVMVVCGQGNYTLALAIAAQPPSSLPNHVEQFGFLAAKAIIQKSSTTMTDLSSAYDTQFTPSVATDHGDLAGLADDDHSQYALESVIGDGLEADDLELSGTTLQLAAEIPHTDVAETISANYDFTAFPMADNEVASSGTWNALNTNVPTELSIGTNNTTALNITSDGGADDVLIPIASTTLTGAMNSAMYDNYVLNNAKVTDNSDGVAEVYDATNWDGDDGEATKNDVRDKIETLAGGHDAVTIGTANGLSLSVQELSLALASTSATGALSNTDWNTFNTKVDIGDAITIFDGTAWRGLYLNATGDVTEFVLGADGTFLESNGASAVPAYRLLVEADISDLVHFVNADETDQTVDTHDEIEAIIVDDILDLGTGGIYATGGDMGESNLVNVGRVEADVIGADDNIMLTVEDSTNFSDDVNIAGSLGIGTTSPASTLEVNGGVNIGGTGAIADNNLSVAGTILTNSNYAMEGYSIGRNVLRIGYIIIQDGTNANTLKISTVNRFHHTAISEVDNIAKDATTSGFTLSADGGSLTIENSILEGIVIAGASGAIFINSTSTNYFISTSDAGDDIKFQARSLTSLTIADWTAIVDAGRIYVDFFYWTSS